MKTFFLSRFRRTPTQTHHPHQPTTHHPQHTTHNTPTHNTPTHNTPTHNTPTHNTPTHNTPTHNTPTHNTPTHNTPPTTRHPQHTTHNTPPTIHHPQQTTHNRPPTTHHNTKTALTTHMHRVVCHVLIDSSTEAMLQASGIVKEAVASIHEALCGRSRLWWRVRQVGCHVVKG